MRANSLFDPNPQVPAAVSEKLAGKKFKKFVMNDWHGAKRCMQLHSQINIAGRRGDRENILEIVETVLY